MTNEELFEKLKGMIVDQLGVDEDSITMESSFVDDLNADSLDMVELVMAMEQELAAAMSYPAATSASRVVPSQPAAVFELLPSAEGKMLLVAT